MGTRARTKFESVSSSLFLMLVVITLMIWPSGCREKEPIKVGFVGGLTGRLSDLGISGRNGALLAVEDANEAGGINGRKIELIIKDDKQDPETALMVDKELIEAGVVAIIGHMTSAMTMAVLPMINKEKVLLISPTTSTNKLTGLDDYLVRITPPNKSETDHLARKAYEELGQKRMTAVYDLSNRAYTEEFYNNFREEFKKKGGRIVLVRSLTSGLDSNFEGLAEKLIGPQPDGVLIVTGALDAAMICQWLRKHRPKLPIIACGWSMTTDFLHHGGSAVEGVIFSTLFDNESKDRVYIDFRERFQSRFGQPPDFAAGNSYEAAMLLISALSENRDWGNLKAAILSLGKFRGIQGEFTLDRNGDPQRRRYLLTIRNGEFKIVE